MTCLCYQILSTYEDGISLNIFLHWWRWFFHSPKRIAFAKTWANHHCKHRNQGKNIKEISSWFRTFFKVFRLFFEGTFSSKSLTSSEKNGRLQPGKLPRLIVNVVYWVNYQLILLLWYSGERQPFKWLVFFLTHPVQDNPLQDNPLQYFEYSPTFGNIHHSTANSW